MTMAYVDALTGLPNRRALDEFLPQLRRRFSLAMVDIDHFKTFNDTHGHDAGDQVLRKVAGHLATVSGGGRVFRYGGEEFCVVFPGQSRKEAQPHLEALRARIEDAGFRLRGRLRPKRKPPERRSRSRGGIKVHVTVSIGVAERGETFRLPAGRHRSGRPGAVSRQGRRPQPGVVRLVIGVCLDNAGIGGRIHGSCLPACRTGGLFFDN